MSNQQPSAAAVALARKFIDVVDTSDTEMGEEWIVTVGGEQGVSQFMKNESAANALCLYLINLFANATDAFAAKAIEGERTQWKQVAEELPPLNEKVLCYTVNGTYEPMKRIEQWWVWLDDIGRTQPASYVTHWQRLPQPPTKREH